jgi:hypothetical protein
MLKPSSPNNAHLPATPHMRPFIALLSSLVLLMSIPLAGAQSNSLIEFDTGRRLGEAPVLLRAIVVRPAEPTGAALLYFRGNPGYMMIRTLNDKQRNLGWVGKGEPLLMNAGITLVMVDCPTDQWGETPRPPATKCLGDYRASTQHADDVRRLMTRLREEYKVTEFYVLGHSIGTISSRWLAINLDRSEIAGSIHSATMNSRSPALRQLLGNVVFEFPRRAAGAPMLHVHNEADACPSTSYAPVRGYARDNLVTVRGGIPEGDPCGGGHLHSHQGREEAVVNAIIQWIKTRKVEDVDPNARQN